MKKTMINICKIIIILVLLFALVVLLIDAYVVHKEAGNLIYEITDNDESLPEEVVAELESFDADCILILGAGIKDSETPSDILKDRLDAGIKLYQEGVAPKILLSGDNGTTAHNEIHVMLKYCLTAGVPAEDIFCDHAGFSTSESMVRAREIFQVEKAIVVTQKYHEYRALFIGNREDIEVLGVAAEQNRHGGELYREIREILARNKDFFKTLSNRNLAMDGEIIPISGDGVVSHGE